MVEFRRIYDSRTKKFLLGTGIPLGIGFIWLLVTLGAITITGASGDMICRGDELEPCYAYINFTANTDVFLYINDTTWVSNNESLKDIIIQRSWGNTWRTIPTDTGCTGSWCGKLGSDTRPFAEYSYAFRAGRNYELRIIAYKHNKDDIIKWGFGDWKTWNPVDPVWQADQKDRYLKLIDTYVDLTYAWSEYEICNPSMIKYLDSMKLEWFGQSTYVKGTNLMVKRNTTQDIATPVYSVKQVCRQPIINETQKQICTDEKYVLRYDTKQTIKTEWVAWDGKLDSNKCNRIRVYGDLIPKFGIRRIDHVPEVFGYKYDEYAWWDSDWGYKKPIEINKTIGDGNFAVCFDVDVPVTAQSNCEDCRFVNSTEDGQLDAFNVTHVGTITNVCVHINETVNTTIYMYYGNAGVSADWRPNATAINGGGYYQSFGGLANGDLVDRDGWTDKVAAASYFTVGSVAKSYEDQKTVVAPFHTDTHAVNRSAIFDSVGDTFTTFINVDGSLYDYQIALVAADPNTFLAVLRFMTSGNMFYIRLNSDYKAFDQKVDTWYKINITMINTTWAKACMSNSTDTFCVSDLLFAGGTDTVAGISLETNGAGSPDGNIYYDKMFWLNTTWDTVRHAPPIVTFKTEETETATKNTESNITGNIEYGTMVRFNTTSGCITDLYQVNCSTNPMIDVSVYPAFYGGVYVLQSAGFNLTDDSEDSYSCSGSFSSSYPCSNAVDENLNTMAKYSYSSGFISASGLGDSNYSYQSFVYENYSIPSDTLNATWFSKGYVYGSGWDFWVNVSCINYSSMAYYQFLSLNRSTTGNMTNNATIPSECLANDVLVLRTELNNWIGEPSGYVGYYDGNVTWSINSTAKFNIGFNNNSIEIISATMNITPTDIGSPPTDIRIDVFNDGKYDAVLDGVLYSIGKMFLNKTTENVHPFNITDGFGVIYIKLYPKSEFVVMNITIGNVTPSSTITVDDEYEWGYDGAMSNPGLSVDEDFSTFGKCTSPLCNVYENFSISSTFEADTLAWHGKVYSKDDYVADVNQSVYWFNWNTDEWDLANNCYAGCLGPWILDWHNESIDTSEYVNADGIFSTKMEMINSDGYQGGTPGEYLWYYEGSINYTLAGPTNIRVDSLNDGTNESYTASISGPTSISLNITGIESYLSSFNSSYELIPVSIIYEPSNINLSVYNVTINYTVYNIPLNISAMNEIVHENSTITVSITANDSVTVRDIYIPYKGNGNITVFNYSSASFSRLENYSLQVYWSNYSVNFPDYVYYPEFIPKINTSKNVTPYGQTTAIPLYNITALGYNKSMNITIYVNESYDTCANITVSNTSTKYGGKYWVLNTTKTTMFTNISRYDSVGLWFWADLYGCSSRWIEWEPKVTACCYDCNTCW